MQRTEALCLTACQELDPDDNHVSMKVDLSPVKHSNETLAKTLIAMLQRTALSHSQTPYLQKL